MRLKDMRPNHKMSLRAYNELTQLLEAHEECVAAKANYKKLLIKKARK